MKQKLVYLLALALLCGSASAQRSTRKKHAPAKPLVADVQPVPADSFSYAMGLSQSGSLKQYLVMREGIDTAYIADVAKGLAANVSKAEAKRAMAYAAGLRIAEMNRSQVVPMLNKQATGSEDTTYTQYAEFTRGLCEGLLGTAKGLTPDSALKLAERQFNYYKGIYKKANADFLAQHAKQKGVKTTKSGLQYSVLSKGTGELPTDTSRVEVHYEGRLIDGTIFDSSYQRKRPATFRVNEVIAGWTEALKMMPVGSLWEIVIPAELGYGERDNQQIPANSTLIFRVELLSIKK